MLLFILPFSTFRPDWPLLRAIVSGTVSPSSDKKKKIRLFFLASAARPDIVAHMKNELFNKMAQMSMDEVAEIAAKMSQDMRDEAGTVLAVALDVLESKMNQADFVRFCEKLA